MRAVRRALSVLAIAAAMLRPGAAGGAEPQKGPAPVDVKVELGTKDDAMRFVPDHLRFERGVYYRLAIHNPSRQSHYFTAEALATRAFTRKIEVLGAGGEPLVEVHGAVHDLELQPGASVAWYFYPMTNGEDLPLYCHKEGHREHGMIGAITISGPAPFQPPSR